MRRPSPPPVRRAPRALRALAGALACAALVAACAPKPTALESYCDVVHQAEATFDPLSRPGSLGNPDVLRRTLTERVTTLNGLASAAPDAVRADAVLVRDRVTAVLNVLAAKSYVAASADGDPAITAVLADTAFADAGRRLADFNGTRCAT